MARLKQLLRPYGFSSYQQMAEAIFNEKKSGDSPDVRGVRGMRQGLPIIQAS